MQTEKIKEMFDARLPFIEIANAVSLSEYIVIEFCRKMGWKRKRGWNQKNYWCRKKGSRTKQPSNCQICNKEIPLNNHKYCSKPCAYKGIRKEKIEKWHGGWSPKPLGPLCNLPPWLRRYILEQANYSCTECGWSKINIYSNRSPLQIDHIDGDSRNNKKDNLRALCPNCHSLTKTYGLLNTGRSTRLYRIVLKKRFNS